jgi:hypothetical protein
MIAKKWVGVMDANAGSIHDFWPPPKSQRALAEIGGVIVGTLAETRDRKNEECYLRCSLDDIPHNFYLINVTREKPPSPM